MKFKPGDVVVCIAGKLYSFRDSWIVEEGKVYTVSDVSNWDGQELIEVEGADKQGITMFATRFELADGAEYNPILHRIKKMEERFNKRKLQCAA